MKSKGSQPNMRKMKTMDRKGQTVSNHPNNHIKKNSNGEKTDSENDYGYTVKT